MIAWSFGFVLLATVVLQTAVPAETLLLDRTVVSGGRWYDGLVTSLGVLAWTVAAAGFAASSFVAGLAGRRQARRIFGLGAALVTALLLDDLFLLHSNVIPKYLGISKVAVLAVQALAVLAWVARAFPEIRRSRWELLAASAAGLGVSVLVDRFGILGNDRWNLIVEDGAKFLGVLALAAWAVSTAVDITRSVASHPAGATATSSSDGSPEGERSMAKV